MTLNSLTIMYSRTLRRKFIFLSTLVTLLKSGKAELEGFIVGGDYVAITKYPHSAYLAIQCSKNIGSATWGCGASIINQRILLTAAHCLDNCDRLHKTKVKVAIGSEHKHHAKTVSASKFVLHPEYNNFTLENDIALIKLVKPLTLNANVKKVMLSKNPPYSDSAAVAGWGVTNDHLRTASLYLKVAMQTLLPREQCLALFGGHMHQGTICAQNSVIAKNIGYAAEGDSGSALVVRDYIQIGLVSFKIRSVSKNVIIYTDVAHFYDWITIVSKHLYCG